MMLHKDTIKTLLKNSPLALIDLCILWDDDIIRLEGFYCRVKNNKYFE